MPVLALNHKLTHLLMHQNKLSGTIPHNIGLMGQQGAGLTELRLDHNQLTGTIPVEIRDLDSLEELNLKDNLLTGYLPLLPESLIPEDVDIGIPYPPAHQFSIGIDSASRWN